MAECYRGVTPAGSVRSLDRTDVFCSKIYRRQACAGAWHEMSIAYTTPRTPAESFDGKPSVMAVVERCRAEYCVGATVAAPALCAPGSALTKASMTELVTWLVAQELTLPEGRAEQWASSLYFGTWLQ